MDKILAVVAIFIVICVILASVIAMGAVPAIFENKAETANQTDIIIRQFQRENNTTHQIISNQGIVIDKLNQSLENQRVMLLQMNKTIVHNQEDLALNLNISREHKQVAKDHDTIQGNVQSVTEQIYELLKKADERNFQATKNNTKLLTNITKHVEEIKKIHKELMNHLK